MFTREKIAETLPTRGRQKRRENFLKKKILVRIFKIQGWILKFVIFGNLY